MRPGQLHEPVDVFVPAAFRAIARATGIATSLAVTVAVERQLVLADLGPCREAAAGYLDDCASRTISQLPLTAASSDFARGLLAALHSASSVAVDDATLVVPTRLADRLRAAPDLEFRAELLHAALAWELAAVRAGRTMTEWALSAWVRWSLGYPLATERQDAAASAAR